jgi:hypothetical protein
MNTSPALGRARAVSAGVKKMPLPMIPPTTSSAAEKSPSSRRSDVCGRSTAGSGLSSLADG